MAKEKKTLTEVFFDAADELGWHCEAEEYSNGNQIRFAKYSPAGEDFSFGVDDTGDCAAIVREVREYASNFDVDEHVEMWIGARHAGVGGIPSTIRELCDDADAIKEMVQELADRLYDEYNHFEPDET